MGDETMVDEYENDQRYAICMSKWEKKNESTSGKTLRDLLDEIKGR